MHDYAALIRRFYEAFAKRDAVGMNACYHENIVFTDPVFKTLHGDDVRAMWSMLCKRGHDLAITYRDIEADQHTGSAHWEALYSFSQTGRSVHNKVEATFVFHDDKIIKHTDHFNLWRWAGQALGTQGLLLGWLPPMRYVIHTKAIKGLRAYQQQSAS